MVHPLLVCITSERMATTVATIKTDTTLFGEELLLQKRAQHTHAEPERIHDVDNENDNNNEQAAAPSQSTITHHTNQDDNNDVNAVEEADHPWSWTAYELYISLGAILGNCARVFLQRAFGGDCSKGRDNAPDDFLAPFFSQICITNSGLTEQTGGALFLDLPANMVGSMMMGMILSDHPLPWFHKGHHLQGHKALVTGFTTGLCGCLTTFASWNTQLIRMLDGTGTVLGPQIAPGLFGYAIGLCAAFASFVMGNHLHEWISSLHTTTSSTDDDERSNNPIEDDESMPMIEEARSSTRAGGREDEQTTRRITPTWKKYLLFLVQCLGIFFSEYIGLLLLVLGLLASFLVGALVYEIPFYQELVFESLAAPLGALLRWKMSNWNGQFQQSERILCGNWNISWIPVGTLSANLLGSVLSAMTVALQVRYLADNDSTWISSILPAFQIGFCGSLSTVSTFIKETYLMKESTNSFLYSVGSLTLAMLLSLAVYSPIIRSA